MSYELTIFVVHIIIDKYDIQMKTLINQNIDLAQHMCV